MKQKISDHWKNKVMKFDEQDKRVLEIAMDVPKTHKVVAVLCFVINFVLPGFGTMIAACATQAETVPKTQIAIGFLQFLTSFVIIGWILSILWGWLIILKAWSYGEQPIPVSPRRSTSAGVRGGDRDPYNMSNR